MYAENSMTKARNNFSPWDTTIWTYSNAKLYKAFILYQLLWLATSPSSLSAFQYCLKHCAPHVSSGICSLTVALCLCFPIELFKKKASVSLGSDSCYFWSSFPSSDNTRLHPDNQSNLAGKWIASAVASCCGKRETFFLKTAFLWTCVLFPFPSL